MALYSEVTCTLLLPPDNGDVAYSSGDIVSDVFDVGVVARYSCSPMFSLEQGSAERVCLSSGEWNGMPPLCIGECHLKSVIIIVMH